MGKMLNQRKIIFAWWTGDFCIIFQQRFSENYDIISPK